MEMDSCLRRNEGKGVGMRGYKAESRRCVAWNEGGNTICLQFRKLRCKQKTDILFRSFMTYNSSNITSMCFCTASKFIVPLQIRHYVNNAYHSTAKSGISTLSIKFVFFWQNIPKSCTGTILSLPSFQSSWLAGERMVFCP